MSSLSPSLELGWETAPILYVVDAADVVRVGGNPLSRPEITSWLSICGGEAEEEGCGECITLAWCLREDDTGEDRCEADPLGDNVEFRLGSAEAKIVSNLLQ